MNMLADTLCLTLADMVYLRSIPILSCLSCSILGPYVLSVYVPRAGPPQAHPYELLLRFEVACFICHC